MGIGNLQNVLGAYDGGRAVPYVQLYFDTAPDNHPEAYRLLSGFGDDSSLYYWRVLGAEQIMHLYRSDRAALKRRVRPRRPETTRAPWSCTRRIGTRRSPTRHGLVGAYASQHVAAAAGQRGSVRPRLRAFGMGALAHRLGLRRRSTAGSRPGALDLLIELAGRVRTSRRHGARR